MLRPAEGELDGSDGQFEADHLQRSPSKILSKCVPRPDTSPIFGSLPHFLLKQIHLSEFLHFTLPVLWLASLSSADQTAAELLQEKKQSEIWCCITMAQTCTYHSTAAASPTLEHHWPSDNSCLLSTLRKKKKQKTKTGLCLWMLAGFNQQEVLWLEAVRIRSIKAQSSFVCTIQKDFNPMLIAFFWWTERDCLWSAIVVQHARPHLTLCIRQHLKKTHILKIQTSVDGLIRRGNCALIRCFWSKAVWFFSTPKALLFIPACVVSVLVDQRDAGREIWEDIQAHLLGSFLWDYPECGF